MALESTASAACTVFVQRELTGELVVAMGIDIQDARAVSVVECCSASLEREEFIWIGRRVDADFQLHFHCVAAGGALGIDEGEHADICSALIRAAQVSQGFGDGRFDGGQSVIFDR